MKNSLIIKIILCLFIVCVGSASAVPVADFTATPMSGTGPLSVTFTDISTNTPTLWEWAYRNATVGWTQFATNQNPVFIFPAGMYDIHLTVTNADGSDVGTQTDYIIVSPAPVPPAADFSSDIQNGTAPLTVKFTGVSTGEGPRDFAWDFNNDGTIDSTHRNPSFIYALPGIYTVRLNVTNPGGSDDETKTDYIHVNTAANNGIALFRPPTGFVYFDYNLDGVGDTSFRYGSSTDQIIKGDWQGTGKDGIALFRPTSGYWYFDYNLDGIVDTSFRFGGSSDQIIKGDWQGTGKDGIALFRPTSGYWYFDYNLDGVVDKSFRFGGASDTIIAGDWQGTRTDGIAIFRPASGYWYFDYNLDGGADTSFRFGGSSDQITTGDWQGTGPDGIAIFRPASGYWYFDYNLDGVVDNSFRYGESSDRIIGGTGNCDSQPVISDMIPDEGTTGRVISVTLIGNNFQNGAIVNLMKRGNSNITATNVVVQSSTLLTCTLPLQSNIVSGLWDVVVTNPDGQYAICTNLFEIEGPFWA